MYNIAIRADGGPAVGMGHIMRCLAIAEQLKILGCRIYFLCRYKQGLDRIKAMGFEAFEIVIKTDETQGQNCEKENEKTNSGFNYGSIEELKEDILATCAIIKQQGCDLILIDKYNLSSDYFINIKTLGIKLAFIDDLNLFDCPADIIINGNINAKLLGYKQCFAGQKLLLGTNYTPLRSEFRDVHERKTRYLSGWQYMPQSLNGREIPVQSVRHKADANDLIDYSQLEGNYNKSKVPEIMITTGGADPYNITGKFLELLLADNKTSDFRYNVIVNSGFIYKDKIEKIANNNSNIVLYIDYKCLSEVMLRSDIAISSGGSTLYELCSCGTPTMAFIMADNQQGIVDMLSSEGYIQQLGWHYEIEKYNVMQRVYDLIMDYGLRKRYSQRMQELVDGRGASRIASEIVSIID
ncbi:hypothetical protein EHE19_000775 [Ruminiclostridium herbifermentans]|uniref:UDP-2,4-diacetamido-2,4, 6-trideoxy-beta-L-altropyranose hydrolase n=1 Tax=Ruminiclostridium herbifermentans TaxID=2488810 RepID=A0A4V6ENX7_9FIRM|nr:hypothetical protein [Ruminiclostridium herbifermentans]QNU67123.1 hypothetical protein EHE19_000775 [Ruminiclostridium herbifermentans]